MDPAPEDFRWQRDYARDFVAGIKRMQEETDVRFAVENMYPWRTPRNRIVRERGVEAYAPGWDPTEQEYPHFTLDLSHTATSRIDTMAMLERMGGRLAHLHLADGSGSNADEHLVPGRGNQPCAQILGLLGRNNFDGNVVLEINTRRAANQAMPTKAIAIAIICAHMPSIVSTRSLSSFGLV